MEIDDEILKPLYDDLNTPGYIANLHKLYDKAQKGNSSDKALFISACKFVGLLNETENQWLEFKKNKYSINETEILEKIEQRNKALSLELPFCALSYNLWRLAIYPGVFKSS